MQYRLSAMAVTTSTDSSAVPSGITRCKTLPMPHSPLTCLHNDVEGAVDTQPWCCRAASHTPSTATVANNMPNVNPV